MNIPHHADRQKRSARRGERIREVCFAFVAVVLCVLMPTVSTSAYTQGDFNSIYNGTPFYDPTDTACAGGSNAMVAVDTSSFKPDPQAVDYFNQTSLPLIKKYLPDYLIAAQDEGVAQNWEILAALQGPESGYADSFGPNGIVGGAKGPSGPYQETAAELAPYLSDPTYGPDLKALVNPDGTANTINKLSDAQFVVLSRLVFKHWVSEALGSGYSVLQNGPIPFDASVDSNNTFWKIMNRWNPGDEATEGFNGYNTGANSYKPGVAVWPGAATTYYLLKAWEASGGLATVAAGASCTTTAGGGAGILAAAERYAGIWYRLAGGHESPATYRKECPDPSNPPASPPNEANVPDGNPNACAVDCSSLVSLAVDDAYHQNFMWTVDKDSGDMSEPQYWQSVTWAQAEPGDIVTRPDHVEILVSYDAGNKTVDTFGAHHTGTQTGEVKNVGSDYYTQIFRYIGPTS